MSETGTVLFIDDEEPLRIAGQQTLELADIECRPFDRAEPALERIDRDFAGVIVTDLRMPGMGGAALLHAVLQKDAELPIILITGHGDVELAVSMMRDGAYDFIQKPFEPERLVDAVRRALAMRSLTLENRRLRSQMQSQLTTQDRFRGASEATKRLRKQISDIAVTDANVLIVGETGTGKSLAAQALHSDSARADKPFITVNCAALPEGGIESELFGHEVGAFAGATRARIGKFEHARRGTLFLDEIDSLPMATQGKLLEAVETGIIHRLGSHDPINLDVRCVAATKTDLESAVADGRFRGDLLYRLNVVTLRMPSLATRREDVPVLFLTFVGQIADRYDVPVPHVPGATLDAIAARDWPGNVRELRNAAERFVLGLPDQSDLAAPTSGTLAERLAEHERALIAASLTAHGGRLKDTYEALGISRKALYEKMVRYGLDRDSFANQQV